MPGFKFQSSTPPLVTKAASLFEEETLAMKFDGLLKARMRHAGPDPASRTYYKQWIAIKLHYVPGFRRNCGLSRLLPFYKTSSIGFHEVSHKGYALLVTFKC